MPEVFNFSGLNKKQANYAFTYWMQNVLNMPVSLSDEAVQNFSKTTGIEPAQLFAAADALDVNVAVIDDLVELTQDDVDDQPQTQE